MNSGRKIIWTVLAGVVCSCGCQTDGLVSHRKVAGAPVVPIEEFISQTRESDTSLAQPEEVDLVEQLVYHRKAYLDTLVQLQQFYDQHGQAEKYRWASNEMAGARTVHTYHYLLDSEVARLDLQPSRSVPEADALYDQAVALAKEAGHGTPAIYNQQKMARALQMFKQLIREYPDSDKIDDAAFYCGELHKEYFKGDDSIAVFWYERAWTWNPATQFPARFQAAVVYDYRLHDRERALELYRAAISAEPQHKSNLRWAQERIKQLTQGVPVESVRSAPIAPGETSKNSGVAQEAPEKDGSQ